jgi:hypothetical protein
MTAPNPASTTLPNLCVFQGVQPPDYYNCEPRVSSCVKPYNDDGTFICQFHLEKYFKIAKMSFRIPSGIGNNEFELLIGKTLIQQNTEEARRIMIPLPSNFIAYLQVDNMSISEKFVFYSIYERNDLIQELCRNLITQEYYTDDLLTQLHSTVSYIMGKVNPAMYCRPEMLDSVRSFDNPPGNGVQTAVYNQYPPFLKNLIRLLVRAQTMTISNFPLIISAVPTCDLVPDRGLVANNLYNPTKSTLLPRRNREKKFQIRTVPQFAGTATKDQPGLQGYEVHVLNRPLFLGTEVYS